MGPEVGWIQERLQSGFYDHVQRIKGKHGLIKWIDRDYFYETQREVMFSKFLIAGINTSAHGQCKKWS